MADFHKYKFYYAGNDAYADGYDRIFGKDKSNEDEKNDQASDFSQSGRRRKKDASGRKSRGTKQEPGSPRVRRKATQLQARSGNA